jgi:hypothetical protein
LTDLDVIALAINSNGDIFAGGWFEGVYRSTDNGVSWTQIGLTSHTISSIALNSKGDIFVGVRDVTSSVNGVYRSTDSGDIWTRTSLALTEHSDVTSFAINSDGDIFAATEYDGVFRSIDNGDTWTQMGLANYYIDALAVNIDGFVFAGTGGSGIFRSLETTTSVEENPSSKDQIPTRFVLEQNYPNPFNPSTTIQYDLPKSAKVVLKIYDLLGHQVRTLVNANQTAGVKSVTWDGLDGFGERVSSGIYIYKMQVNGQVHSRKTSFIK